jgi:hypothetical protein
MKTPKHQKDYLSYIVQAEKLDGFMREAQLSLEHQILKEMMLHRKQCTK